MTLKIRKLYNVLVVGGMAAATLGACEKQSPGPATVTSPSKIEPAANVEPSKPEPIAEPSKPEPIAEAPAVADAQPEPAAVVAPAAVAAKQPAVAKKAAPKQAPRKVPAKPTAERGLGARAWN